MTYEKTLLNIIKRQHAALKEFVREYDYNADMEDRNLPDPPHVAQARELLQ